MPGGAKSAFFPGFAPPNPIVCMFHFQGERIRVSCLLLSCGLFCNPTPFDIKEEVSFEVCFRNQVRKFHK
jgi:hypothetical protein